MDRLLGRVDDCPDGSCPTTPTGFSVCTIVRAISVALLLLLAWMARAEVVSELAADSVRIGDVVQWRVTVPGAEPETIVWPPVTEQFGDFYVLGADTLNEKKSAQFGGPTVVYNLAAYDTGMVSTGDLELSGPNGLETISADSLRIVSVLEAPSDTVMAPLKPQESLPVTFMDVLRWSWPWILGAAVLALLYWWWTEWKKRRRRRELGEDDEPAVPPYEEAMAALDQLQRDNPYDRGDSKGYVGELTFIVKRLLDRTHRDPVLDMTTYEVDLWLDKGYAQIKRDELLDLLRKADTVKFAKMTLPPHEADELFADAKRMVEAYRDLPAARGIEEEQETAGENAGETEAAMDVSTKQTSTGSEKAEQSVEAAREQLEERDDVLQADVIKEDTPAAAKPKRTDDRSYLPPPEPGMPPAKPGWKTSEDRSDSMGTEGSDNQESETAGRDTRATHGGGNDKNGEDRV